MNKISKNIEKLITITKGIKNTDIASNQEELSLMLYELDKIVRSEHCLFYAPYLSDTSFALALTALANDQPLSEKDTINMISILGNMIKRYHLPPLLEIFHFFYAMKEVRKIDYYISLFIFYFPQFINSEERWLYLINMVKISPKNKSEMNFHAEVKKIISTEKSIPLHYRNLLIEEFKHLMQNSKNNVCKNDYRETIEKIKNMTP